MEHGLLGSRSRGGGNAENAQHAQNAPQAVVRHSQRQHTAHVAQGTVAVFFMGGAGFSLNSPTKQQSAAEGGGFNLDSLSTEQLATGVVSFFARHHQFACAGRRALHFR